MMTCDGREAKHNVSAKGLWSSEKYRNATAFLVRIHSEVDLDLMVGYLLDDELECIPVALYCPYSGSGPSFNVCADGFCVLITSS